MNVCEIILIAALIVWGIIFLIENIRDITRDKDDYSKTEV